MTDTAIDPGPRPDFVWISPDKCRVDDRYQRSADSKRSLRIIETIKSGFTWSNFGAVTLADNLDGTYCVIDGQHRTLAAQAIGIEEIPALVIDAETLKEQANAFIGINKDRVAASPLNVFHSQVLAGDTEARAISEVLKAAGCRLSKTMQAAENLQPDMTVAVAGLRSSYRNHGAEPLTRALRCIRTAWPDTSGELRAGIIKALALIFAEDLTVNFDVMVAAIGTRGAEERTDGARAYRSTLGRPVSEGIKEGILTDYRAALRNIRKLNR